MDELLREINEINAVANLRADYSKTLALLRALKAGRVALGQVTLLDDGWQLAASEPVDVESIGVPVPAEPPAEQEVSE